MNKMVWLMPLLAVTICFAGQSISRESSGRKQTPSPEPLERSESPGRHCTLCEQKVSEFIAFCQTNDCGAIMCRSCEESECRNKQLISRNETELRKLRKSVTTRLFFVCVTCKLCEEKSRLYAHEGTQTIRAIINDRAQHEEAAFVYQ